MGSTPEKLILASASTARAQMLRCTGVEFTIAPAGIDESAIKRQYRESRQGALACAQALAEAKAWAVAARHPESLVIGADQILVAGEEWFDKPVDLDGARAQLRQLAGRVHTLATA